jgi:hypothetical protein
MSICSWISSRLSRQYRTARRQTFARRPQLEALEDRSLPSTFVVTNTNDAGLGSLCQAILDANANPGPDIIDFDIAGKRGVARQRLFAAAGRWLRPGKGKPLSGRVGQGPGGREIARWPELNWGTTGLPSARHDLA